MKKIYKKDIDKVMSILQALEKGKTIQFAVTDKEWIDLNGDKDGLSLETLINSPQFYRVKPEFKYRPFKDAEECWAEMQKHQPFGWVKDSDGSKFTIETIASSDSSIFISDEGAFYLGEMFEKFKFADGTPFGVKEEE